MYAVDPLRAWLGREGSSTDGRLLFDFAHRPSVPKVGFRSGREWSAYIWNRSSERNFELRVPFLRSGDFVLLFLTSLVVSGNAVIGLPMLFFLPRSRVFRFRLGCWVIISKMKHILGFSCLWWLKTFEILHLLNLLRLWKYQWYKKSHLQRVISYNMFSSRTKRVRLSPASMQRVCNWPLADFSGE